MIRLTVSEDSVGTRIDAFIAEATEMSRSGAAKLIEKGDITVNGTPVSKKYAVKYGDLIEITPQETEEYDAVAENIPLDIVYEDTDIIVINKPKGMVVHPAPGNYTGTLVNALLYHCKGSLSGIGGVMRPGIVHRIDKDTTGLIVVAKNDRAHLSLAKQLEDKTCKRIYYALLEGVVKEDKGRISTFIGRNPNDRTKMAVLSSGRDATTDFTVIERFKEHTLCKFSLQTGRTHQIRVHAKYMGHPVVGDPEYGYKNQKFKLNGQLLHAGKLEFIHPTTNKRVSFTCDLPDYFEKILKTLRK